MYEGFVNHNKAFNFFYKPFYVILSVSEGSHDDEPFNVITVNSGVAIKRIGI
jgi:hypothetical protein